MADTTGPTVTVDGQALRQVLVALVGQPHDIRELQVTRSLHKLGHPNPIDILIEQLNASVEQQATMQMTVSEFAQRHHFKAADASKILWRAALDDRLTVTENAEFKATYHGSFETFDDLALQERQRLTKLRAARARRTPKKPKPPSALTRFAGGRNPWTGRPA